MVYLGHTIRMPRKPNPVPSKKIAFTTTPHVEAYLDQLVRRGLHGKNAGEAAERLVASALERLIEKGYLKSAPAKPSKGK